MVIKQNHHGMKMGAALTRKQQIVDAAIKLFLEKGIPGTSMRDLAAAVGMKAGSLYNHFTSKDEIIDQVVKRGSKSVQKLRDFYQSLGEISPADAVRKSIICWIMQAQEDRRRIILLNRESPASNPVRQQEIMNDVQSDVRDFNDFFGGLLGRGVAAGIFAIDDIPLVIFNIWTFKIEWALRPWWLRSNYTIEEYAEKQAENIIKQITFRVNGKARGVRACKTNIKRDSSKAEEDINND